MIYPEYSAFFRSYKKGDRVEYNGDDYEAIRDVGWFKNLFNCPEESPDWKYLTRFIPAGKPIVLRWELRQLSTTSPLKPPEATPAKIEPPSVVPVFEKKD